MNPNFKILLSYWSAFKFGHSFLHADMTRKTYTFKLGSSLGKHAEETNTEVFTISSGGFVNIRMKIFRSFLVTIFKTLVIYRTFVENLLTI